MRVSLSASQEALPPNAPASPPARNTVLIVEDDEAIGSLMAMLIAPLTPQVARVRDAASSLRWLDLNAASLSLAIMDCGLPDAYGDSLAFRLRMVVPGLPLLLTSGRPCPDALRVLAADGPADFLAKPFRPGDVLSRVRALLGGRVGAA